MPRRDSSSPPLRPVSLATPLGIIAPVPGLVYQRNLDVADLVILAKMSRLHGAAIAFADQQVPISVVAFFGRYRDGHPECAGYYRYTPLQNAHVTDGRQGPMAG